MPGNKLWDDAGNHNSTVLVPDWADNNLFGDIEAIFDQQVQDSRDRVVRPEKKEYTESEAMIAAAFTVETIRDEKTVVVLVVRDVAHPEKNTPKHIHCQDGTGFCGYVRDLGKDSYIAECVDFLSLGNVHVAYRVSMPGTGGWNMKVPMPQEVVERLISPYYKRALSEARAKYPQPEYELHFMQMIGCD